MKKSAEHVYVHVPFCDGKCSYCAFYSLLYTPSQADRYITAIEQEISFANRYIAPLVPRTVYIGGGTPTVLDPRQLGHLLQVVKDAVPLAHLREWTVEANPGTLTAGKLGLLCDAGVNRISIGAQSFDDDVLRCIGRRHGVDDILRAVQFVGQSGIANWGLDLIACLPGVDDPTWGRTLDAALRLGPKHLSVYALSLEEGTRFHELLREGRLQPSDPDDELRVLDATEARLRHAGYVRYEISNFALPGYECAHNTAVWKGEDYIGFGPAASSRVGLERWTNKPDLPCYIESILSEAPPPSEDETLSPATDAAERLAFCFRLQDGVDLRAYAMGRLDLEAAWEEALARLSGEGLARKEGDLWLLTPAGRSFADRVAAEILSATPEDDVTASEG